MRFFKYHGLGNDFVVLDRLEGGEGLSAERVRSVCDRHQGVGADGVLTLWSSPNADARMQIQNADGSAAVMCGNGIRCVAQYLVDAGRVQGAPVIAVADSVYTCRRRGERFVVDMGTATSDHADLPPGGGDGLPADRARLEIEEGRFVGTRLALGNPHFVVFVDVDVDVDVDANANPNPNANVDPTPAALAERFGRRLSEHPAFPDRANISFVSPGPDGLDAVIYERGVGITQACGSGACAIGAAAVRRGLARAGDPIDVRLPGGTLVIVVSEDGAITMEGPAVRVFEGELP